jgi:hypothetical protein
VGLGWEDEFGIEKGPVVRTRRSEKREWRTRWSKRSPFAELSYDPPSFSFPKVLLY